METQDDMIRITVIIAGRPYPLKVNSKDEPIVHKIVDQVNKRVNNFHRAYKKDKQDLLAMTLLTFAMDLHKANVKNISNTPTYSFSESIQEIDDLLEGLIEKHLAK